MSTPAQRGSREGSPLRLRLLLIVPLTSSTLAVDATSPALSRKWAAPHGQGPFIKVMTHPAKPGRPELAPFEGTSTQVACPATRARCTWERTFGGALKDKAYAVAATADDGIVVAGTTQSYRGLVDDAWVLRLDRTGKVLWDRRIGGFKNDQVYGVLETDDGGVLVAGSTRSRGSGKSDAWVFRFDKFGETLWDRTYGGPEDDLARSVAAAKDGTFVIAGSTRSAQTQSDDAWILKIDGQGDPVWEQTLAAGEDEGMFGVKVMPDGDLVAAGYKDSGTQNGYDASVVRLDSEGSVIWRRSFGHGVFDAASSIASLPDGGCVVVGVTSKDGFRKDDAWVLRLQANGDVLWERTFGGPQPDSAWDVVTTADGGYVVTAATSSFGLGSSDAWMLRLDADGTLRWERLYGGRRWDRPAAVALAADGGMWMVGYTTTKGAGYEDYWLLRLDAQGLL